MAKPTKRTGTKINAESFVGKRSAARGESRGVFKLVAGNGIKITPKTGVGLVKVSIESSVTKELDSLKITFQKIFKLEEKYYDHVQNKILDFVRNDDKTKLKERESSQENKSKGDKKDSGKNSIVKGVAKGLEGLFNFFGDILKWFITYKIIEWVSKKENIKKIENIVKFISGVVKFVGSIVGFGIDKIFTGLSHLVDG